MLLKWASELIFKNRNFIFGDTPTLADIGLSGPFFRHFALDPVPLKIIRENYPYIMKWVSRLCNTKLSENQNTSELFDQDVNEDEDFDIPAFLRRQKF